MAHRTGYGIGRGSGRGVMRYVEASLLLLLARQPAHGHQLSKRLKDVFPLPDNLPDASTVYRSLVDLEAQGAVQSTWGPGEGGGRKIYELTADGRDLLAAWDAQFRREHVGLTRFLQQSKPFAHAPASRDPPADPSDTDGNNQD